MLWCMQRTNIYLDESQTAALDTLARREGISRAELVRRFIDRCLTTRSGEDDTDVAAIEESFGVLAQIDDLPARGTDGRAAHLEALRAR